LHLIIFSGTYTLGWTPLGEGSARRRDLYMTTRNIYKSKTHAPSGFRTHSLTKTAAADLRLRDRAATRIGLHRIVK